jgi:G3E family GTPase
MKSDRQQEPRFNANGKPRFVMVGGFMGAGKTTCIVPLAKYLIETGCKVGLITNGQGDELVDTGMLRARGFATEEVRGGCFCCRFDSLIEATEKLSGSTHPDVFIAEPVGSCADLVATVSYPLRRLHGNNFGVAPLSVVVDPVRAGQMFGLQSGPKFSDKIAYIYRKQLEEADVIVINKSDLVEPDALKRLQSMLSSEYPKAEIFEASAREGTGLEKWFEKILTSHAPSRQAMKMDYEIYAQGEALLSWLNCMVKLSSRKYFKSSEVLMIIASSIQDSLRSEGAELVHLKMTLNSEDNSVELAVINLAGNDYVPELSQELPEPIDSGELIINMRAEADPRLLNTAVNRAVIEAVEKTPTLFARMERCEHFRPPRPEPTHRIESVG